MHLPWVLLAVLSPSPSLDEVPHAHAIEAHGNVADEPRRPADPSTQVAQQKPKPKPKPKPGPDYCPPCGRG